VETERQRDELAAQLAASLEAKRAGEAELDARIVKTERQRDELAVQLAAASAQPTSLIGAALKRLGYHKE